MEEIIFWMEDAADSGVKKIADKVAGDVELVTDRRPRVLYGTSQEELADVAERAETVIVPATVGKSRLLEQMEEEKRIGLEQKTGVLWLVFPERSRMARNTDSSDCRER